jgi:hypothetical protein
MHAIHNITGRSLKWVRQQMRPDYNGLQIKPLGCMEGDHALIRRWYPYARTSYQPLLSGVPAIIRSVPSLNVRRGAHMLIWDGYKLIGSAGRKRYRSVRQLNDQLARQMRGYPVNRVMPYNTVLWPSVRLLSQSPKYREFLAGKDKWMPGRGINAQRRKMDTFASTNVSRLMQRMKYRKEHEAWKRKEAELERQKRPLENNTPK